LSHFNELKCLFVKIVGRWRITAFVPQNWQPQFGVLAGIERPEDGIVHLRGFYADGRN
jgi:hypothetical protein